MRLVIETTSCEECGLPMHPLLAIKCPHCGEIQSTAGIGTGDCAELNRQLGWDL